MTSDKLKLKKIKELIERYIRENNTIYYYNVERARVIRDLEQILGE
jgi:hypothetical protein